MPAIKKVSTSHLPEVEKKRRETWHPKASYDVHVTLPLYDPNKPDNHQNDRESLTDSEEETSETSPTHRVKRTSRQMTNDINPVAKLSNSYIPALTVVAEEGTALPDILSIDSLPCQSMRHSGDNLEEPKANGFNNNLMDFSHPNSPFPDMRYCCS